MRFKVVAVASLALVLTEPALAGNPFDEIFARGGKLCYARDYDAAHFAAHPRQTVAGIAISYAPTTADGAANTAARFEVGLGFGLKNGQEWFEGSAVCAAKGAGFDCSLEGDGGQFRLTPHDGGLRFEVVNRGGTDAGQNQIVVEGDDFGGFGKPGGGDLVFDLKRTRAAVCDSQSGFGG